MIIEELEEFKETKTCLNPHAYPSIPEWVLLMPFWGNVMKRHDTASKEPMIKIGETTS